MIALPARMPYVKIGEDTFTPCQEEWLSGKLRSAARDTQVPEWLAEDIGKGVCSYLANHYDGTMIEVADLFDRIRGTLNSLGFGELATTLDDAPPPVSISISDLARRAGSGYELVFYQMLEKSFQNAAKEGATQVDCYGLKGGVKRLANVKKWSSRCDLLKSEIEHFLHHQHRYIADDQPNLKFSLCD